MTHRLRVAGAGTDTTFTRDAISLVHQESKGIPRIINALCDNAMLAGYVSRQKQITVSEIKRAREQVEVPG